MYQVKLELTAPQAALLKNILLEYLMEHTTFTKLSYPFDRFKTRVQVIRDYYVIYREFLPLFNEVSNNQLKNFSYSSPYDMVDAEDIIYIAFGDLINTGVYPSTDEIIRSKHDNR